MRSLVLKTHALGLAIATAAARAADSGSSPDESRFVLISPPPEPVVLWRRFDSGFENSANGVFADALQPLNVIKWNVDLRGKDFSENFRDLSASRAQGAFDTTLEYGAREAIVELPFMVWLEENQSALATLLRGSIDNVNEEVASPLDISHESVQQSWWRTEASHGTDYGLRPMRRSPYAYLSQAITDGERTLLLAHVRYYYDHLAHHRAELGLSMPLDYGISLEVGNSYEFGAHAPQRFAVQLVKELTGGGAAQIGFEVRQHPALIAGITFAW